MALLLPTGTVTFLFTDIEGSTRLWERNPEAMRPALARHDELLRESIEANGGYVFKTIGDGVCAAFPTAPEALQAAHAAQLALADETWETETAILVRMALHTGAAEERDGDYFGPPLNRAARLMAAGHGGQLLLSAATQELTRDALPDLVTFRDLGLCRLKDLARPETVFQLLHPGLAADFPPLRSLDDPGLPNNLPPQMTSFIGRERDVAAVKALLDRTRLLTLTGAGGSGKTRLALQVAADALDGHADGAWLVELASLSDPALIPQTVAQALGVREEPGKALRQTLAEWLRPKRLLLVLDNCEHLLDACASLAAELLRACPQVHLLASSREALNVPGEQTYRVPSLSLPDPKQPQTVEGLSHCEAVTLFLERARAVLPDFTVTDTNAPAVARVCSRLDGIPLAIELAAARVRALSVEQVNTRLDQRFRLLTGGSRTALPRQQTLRALIDWSYDLLSEQEKILLCRLSVFAGGWTLAAAEAVCAGGGVEVWEVLDGLTALVDKSLATADLQGDDTRYRLGETVRQYAGERLAAGGEAEAVRDAHLAWCLALAEEALPRLSGPDQGLWLGRLETDHDNLRAGLAWAGASPGVGAEPGLRLAGALARFWLVRGHWTEGRACLAAALADGTAGDTPFQARAQQGLARLARSQGDWAAARTLYEQALAVFAALRDRRGEASSLSGLGLVAHDQGDWAAAHALHEQSLAIFRELGDRSGEASDLSNLGLVELEMDDLEAAGSRFEQALAIFRALGNRNYEANTLNNLGLVKSDLGDRAAARALFAQSLAIKRALGDRRGEANSLTNLGQADISQGDWGAAHAHLEQALAIYRALGDRSGEAVSLHHLGVVECEGGALALARGFLTRSLMLKRQLDNRGGTLDTLVEWAALALAEGDAPRAVRLLAAAQAGREDIDSPLSSDQTERHDRTLAAARAALGDPAFTAAWDAGRVMTLDEAVAYALAND